MPVKSDINETKYVYTMKYGNQKSNFSADLSLKERKII